MKNRKSFIFIIVISMIIISDLTFGQELESVFNRPFRRFNSEWYQLDSGDTFKVVRGEILIKVHSNLSEMDLNRFLSNIDGTVLDTFNTNILHIAFNEENDDIEAAKSLSGLNWVIDAKPNVYIKYAYSDAEDPGLGDQDWLDDGRSRRTADADCDRIEMCCLCGW